MHTLFSKWGARLSALPFLLVPGSALAQVQNAQRELQQIANEGGATATNLPALVGNLVNVFISVLGIIFVILIVYAGFLYMTAGGEEDNVKKAKKLLSQSIIGLIIIISAYAISFFIFESLATATGTAPAA